MKHPLNALTRTARSLYVDAITWRIASVAGLASVGFIPTAQAANIGDDVRGLTTQISYLGLFLQAGAAVAGIGMVAYGIYSYVVLHKQDPREHTAGKAIGMALGGAALASVGFLSGHLSETLFGTSQTGGMDTLGGIAR